MDPELKKRIRLACVFQGVVWGLGLVTMAVLSFVPSQQTGFFFENILLLVSLGMFVTPLAGIFFFVRYVSGNLKKFIYATSFVLVIWALNILGVGLVQVSKWESFSDKKARETEIANKPIYDKMRNDLEKKITSIGTAEAAENYVKSVVLERKAVDISEYYPGRKSDQVEFLINLFRSKQKMFGDKAVAKMAFLLMQYSGGDDGEDMSSLCGEILWNDTSAAVEAMGAAKKDLLPEFKNEEFYKGLYETCIWVPYDNTDLSESERRMKAKPIKDRLKALRNSSNSDFVDYLLKGDFEHWTY